jgi:hypothetical protein
VVQSRHGASKILSDLARGAPDARLTAEAASALRRLTARDG